jgi:hypothetical protein
VKNINIWAILASIVIAPVGIILLGLMYHNYAWENQIKLVQRNYSKINMGLEEEKVYVLIGKPFSTHWEASCIKRNTLIIDETLDTCRYRRIAFPYGPKQSKIFVILIDVRTKQVLKTEITGLEPYFD